MGDRWVLGDQGLRWSDGMRPAATGAAGRSFAARLVWTVRLGVRVSTNDTQTMMMLGLGARWVLARHGLVSIRWTFSPRPVD
jgi:hypothetical protein